MRPTTWLAPLAALLAVAGAAGAQGLALQADDIPADVPPGGEAALRLHLTAQCSDLLTAVPTGANVVFAAGEGSPHLTLGGDLQPAVPLEPCRAAPTGILQWSHNLTVALSASAPGLQVLGGNVTATIERGPLDPLAGSAAYRLRGAYVGRLEVAVGEPEVNATANTGVVRLAVANLGNARTAATFLVLGDPTDFEGPADLVLDAAGSGGQERGTVEFVYAPDTKDWREAAFQIEVKGHAYTASVFGVEAQTVDVAFTNPVTPKKDTPAPAASLLVPALLALAVLRRRA